MPVTAFASGTQTTSIGTEHFLVNVNQAGVYILHVDLNALVTGDILEVRVYQMVLTAGAPREEQFMVYNGVQDIKIKRSAPLSNELTDAQALRFSIKQTFGSSRSIPWKVLKHG
ncbi:MAG TPA: hypothetical protein VKD91_14075 [Pyrinomonadaceae bacterium]|nr:hypothetical protein [Pyrinomonadaceae bacterium]